MRAPNFTATMPTEKPVAYGSDGPISGTAILVKIEAEAIDVAAPGRKYRGCRQRW